MSGEQEGPCRHGCFRPCPECDAIKRECRRIKEDPKKDDLLYNVILCRDGNIHQEQVQGDTVTMVLVMFDWQHEVFTDEDAKELDEKCGCGPHAVAFLSISRWTQEEIDAVKKRARELQARFGGEEAQNQA